MQPTPVMYPYVHHLLSPLLFLRVSVVSPLMDVLGIWHDVCFHDEISQVARLRPLGKGGGGRLWLGGWEGVTEGWSREKFVQSYTRPLSLSCGPSVIVSVFHRFGEACLQAGEPGSARLVTSGERHEGRLKPFPGQRPPCVRELRRGGPYKKTGCPQC